MLSLWNFSEFLFEGILGTAALLVLPVLVLWIERELGKIQQRREDSQSIYVHLGNHFLDRIIHRS